MSVKTFDHHIRSKTKDQLENIRKRKLWQIAMIDAALASTPKKVDKIPLLQPSEEVRKEPLLLPMKTGIILTPEQQYAHDKMLSVLTGPRGGKLIIGGLGGTGKTSLIRTVMDRVEGTYNEPAVVAFTGRAANILRSKGVVQAQTLHSLIYRPHVNESTGKVTFSKQPYLEAGSVIVDEASMLNQSLYDDLMSYKVPVVFVGDHGQLPPIGDDPGVMKKPDIRLEQIHRQAADSPILSYAHARREGKTFDWSKSKSDDLQRLTRSPSIETLLQHDVAICGFNKTRISLNHTIRNARGRKDTLEVGETLSCLRNDRERSVFNGMTFTVEKILQRVQMTIHAQTKRLDDAWIVNLRDDSDRVLTEVPMVMRNDQNDKEIDQGIIVADYGYALTCHRAQGGQWPSVVVFEESWEKAWDQKRWSYTASSRAIKKLTWVIE